MGRGREEDGEMEQTRAGRIADEIATDIWAAADWDERPAADVLADLDIHAEIQQ